MQRTPLLMVLMTAFAVTGFCADWNPKLAADYLDSRQKEWFRWPRAKVEGGVCVSCHTGVTYLLARPVLRKALAESQPTAYEKGLLEGLHAQAEAEGNRQGAETVFAALFFSIKHPEGGFVRARTGRRMDHCVFGTVETCPEAPPAEGSNSYATGYVAFVLQQAGLKRSDPAVRRALDWL